MFNKFVKVSIVVASMTQGKSPVDAETHKRVSSATAAILCTLFGGFTSHKGRGGWIGAGGVLHSEDVEVFETLAVGGVSVEAREALVDFARGSKVELDQESVMLSIGDEVAFI